MGIAGAAGATFYYFDTAELQCFCFHWLYGLHSFPRNHFSLSLSLEFSSLLLLFLASSLHLFLFPFFLPCRVPRCDSHFGYLFLSFAPVVAWCNKACERSLVLLPLCENVEMLFCFFFFMARYTPGVSALFSLEGILCKTINWMKPLIRNVISWARRFVTGISCVYTGFFLLIYEKRNILAAVKLSFLSTARYGVFHFCLFCLIPFTTLPSTETKDLHFTSVYGFSNFFQGESSHFVGFHTIG